MRPEDDPVPAQQVHNRVVGALVILRGERFQANQAHGPHEVLTLEGLAGCVRRSRAQGHRQRWTNACRQRRPPMMMELQ